MALCLALAASGCVREVLAGEDPDVARPTATGDSKRDQLVINVPWMQPPVPRVLVDGQPIVCEHVSGLTPEHKIRYVMRTMKGVTVQMLITMDIPTPDVTDFTYEVQSLPSGYTVDLPIGLGQVGRRGPIDLVVNGAPYHAPPTVDVAIVPLSRDEKTRIRATRIKPPAETNK